MRRAAAVDANQSEIVAALRKIGATVQPLHAVGGGCPDLLVGFGHAMNFLFEVKDGSKPLSQRKLTPAQVDFHANWRGQVCVVSSVDEAFHALSSGVAMVPFRGVVR